jgi:hypothetical protein
VLTGRRGLLTPVRDGTPSGDYIAGGFDNPPLPRLRLAACMPHFLLTFGDASRPPLGAAIIEAPSVFQACMTAVVRRLAPGVPFGEVLYLSAKMMMSIPPEQIGRMLSGKEASILIRRLVEGRDRLWE